MDTTPLRLPFFLRESYDCSLTLPSRSAASSSSANVRLHFRIALRFSRSASASIFVRSARHDWLDASLKRFTHTHTISQVGAAHSEHAHPLRSAHPNRPSCSARQIKRYSACERSTIIDHHCDRCPGLRVHDRDPRAEGQRAMRRRKSTGIERLTARRSSSGNVVGRNDVLT